MGFDSIKPKVKELVTPSAPRDMLLLSTYRSEKRIISQKMVSTAFAITAGVFFASAVLFNSIRAYANVGGGNIDSTNWTSSTPATSSGSHNSKETVLSNFELASPLKIIPVKPKLVSHGGFESVYKEAEKKYGISWQILAAIHMVESGQSGDSDQRSSAGAIGPMQFMQTTFDVYAQDGDDDGTKSITDVHDAIFTTAKMLTANGGKHNIAQALYRYNHCQQYVDQVLLVARDLGFNQ